MKLTGVILILSCKKYINTRVQQNFIDRNLNAWSEKWKFISLIGDNNIETKYIFDSKKNILVRMHSLNIFSDLLSDQTSELQKSISIIPNLIVVQS